MLCHLARHDESLVALGRLEHRSKLDLRDRYRVTIYRAMNLSGLGSHLQVEDLLSVESDRARADCCMDEFVLMSAIRAQARTIRGQPRDSLRIIARTLPVAHGHELYFRLNILYRLAAGAYQDLGQPRKAIAYQRKAIALAGALGLSEFEAMSWLRLSEYERVLGNFGNAIRYLAKTGTIMAKSSYEVDRAQLALTKLHLHIWLCSPDLPRVIKEAAWIEETGNVNERARYFMMMGSYRADEGDWDEAWHCYAEAMTLLRRTRFADHLIVLCRARLRLSILMGLRRRTRREFRTLNSRALRVVGSTTRRLERDLALLEFAYHARDRWTTIHSQQQRCLHLCDESAEAMARLEALSLVFRVCVRFNKYAEAEAAFRMFYALLKSASSNLEDRYIDGLMRRLNLAELTQEYDLVRKRNKAGVGTSLVA